MRFIADGNYRWTQQELMNKYERANRQYHLGTGIFAVVLKVDNTVIGEAGLFDSFNSLEKLELGYIIDSKYWKKGYGQEVCLGLINYAFNTLPTHTLVARMYAQNKSSVNLSEKCGMLKTGAGQTSEGKAFLEYIIEKTNSAHR